MRKSIYFRLVLIFIMTIFVGMFLSLELTNTIYFDKIYKGITSSLIETSKDISNIYKNREEEDFEKIIRSKVFSNYSIQIYKDDNTIKYFEGDNEKFKISSGAKKTVHDGMIYLNESKLNKFCKSEMPIVGYPFEINNEKYAVFVSPNFIEILFSMSIVLRINLLVMVLTGIVTFTIVSRILSKRINKITIASRQVAKGDYRVRVEDKKGDEISELSDTFNLMVDKLGKTEKMRQEFVSNVSHEIQSPITSIMGFANILQSDYVDEESKKTYAKIIEDESRRLSKLGENLLKLASLDNDQNVISKEIYYLDEQIRRIVLMLEPKWSSKNIEFELDLPKTKIDADKYLLEQVWINLIGNSIKFSDNGSNIYIIIRDDNENTNVSIKDNGIGINDEDIDKIFDRFYQADESRKIEGSGLGLSIVRKIVKIHDGNIVVNSELGKGSVFIISL